MDMPCFDKHRMKLRRVVFKIHISPISLRRKAQGSFLADYLVQIPRLLRTANRIVHRTSKISGNFQFPLGVKCVKTRHNILSNIFASITNWWLRTNPPGMPRKRHPRWLRPRISFNTNVRRKRRIIPNNGPKRSTKCETADLMVEKNKWTRFPMASSDIQKAFFSPMEIEWHFTPHCG